MLAVTDRATLFVIIGIHRVSSGNKQEPWCQGLGETSVAWFLRCLHLLLHLSLICPFYPSYSSDINFACAGHCLPLQQPAPLSFPHKMGFCLLSFTLNFVSNSAQVLALPGSPLTPSLMSMHLFWAPVHPHASALRALPCTHCGLSSSHWAVSICHMVGV